jgi:hypothetical protein
MEAADQIQEAAEGGGGEQDKEQFRARAALIIAIMAMLLAISSLGGGNVAEDMLVSHVHASDTWAFYQAKNMRQTSYELASDALEADLAVHGKALTPEARTALKKKIDEYRATAARYDSEPGEPAKPGDPPTGEGKKELRARAEYWEKQREIAQTKDPNFDYAEVFFQIAIVLGSVAILATSMPVLMIGLASGALATLLMLNGYFLLFKLPF